jgi:glutathione S-transferase
MARGKVPLTLHFHPLASFCHKALIALYENDLPFERVIVDFADPVSAANFRALWPMAKMPVLRDDARGKTVAESTIVIEHLEAHYPGPSPLIPAGADEALEVRMWDRVFDSYVHLPMQKVVTDRLRPEGERDAYGVRQACDDLVAAYDFLEERMRGRRWCMGDAFTLADCAAAPALFYADTVAPIPARTPALNAYLDRLMSRPSYARVLAEAEPYFGNFPLDKKPSRRRGGGD